MKFDILEIKVNLKLQKEIKNCLPYKKEQKQKNWSVGFSKTRR